MDESKRYHFILIDDSKLDCFIGEKVIQGIGVQDSLHVFMDAKEALEYIKNRETDTLKTIILVDIQMPLMTGFQFIEAFEEAVPEEKQGNYIINLLSSSINQNDIIKAKSYKSVNDFLNKPIRKDTLQTLVSKL